MCLWRHFLSQIKLLRCVGRRSFSCLMELSEPLEASVVDAQFHLGFQWSSISACCPLGPSQRRDFPLRSQWCNLERECLDSGAESRTWWCCWAAAWRAESWAGRAPDSLQEHKRWKHETTAEDDRRWCISEVLATATRPPPLSVLTLTLLAATVAGT